MRASQQRTELYLSHSSLVAGSVVAIRGRRLLLLLLSVSWWVSLRYLLLLWNLVVLRWGMRLEVGLGRHRVVRRRKLLLLIHRWWHLSGRHLLLIHGRRLSHLEGVGGGHWWQHGHLLCLHRCGLLLHRLHCHHGRLHHCHCAWNLHRSERSLYLHHGLCLRDSCNYDSSCGRREG